MTRVVAGSPYRDAVLAALGELVDSLDEVFASLVRPLLASPGKLLRSELVWLTASAGQPRRQALVRFGALVELLHIATLVHDDVIDRAATRRGVPAAHRQGGQELAVLAGTACFAAVGLEAADLGAAIATAVSRTVGELSYGELLDIERGFDPGVPTEDYLELTRRKTGALFQLSCVLGATASGLPGSVTAGLAEFGARYGIAFQVLDDCLDLHADGTGKPAGTDHLLGLFGLPTLCALRGREPAATQLRDLLLSPDLAVTDLPRISDLIAESGGLEAAHEVARTELAAALAVLDNLRDELPAPALNALTEFANRTAGAP
ncbi:polyprenyl synthetase family protein [Kribbella koreensis]|uniref:Polyprenyl synthetase family protein n=1 Tax=Kribbella koreensis TaxID=57909 RepID=A0ABP4A233_9ACTN